MTYKEIITLKNNQKCLLRNATRDDGKEALSVFLRTHEQTDFLFSYPEESTYTAESQGEYLQKKADSPAEIEILAIVDGKIVGLAGIDRIADRIKVRHRADFGVCVDRDMWHLGIGKALTKACIDCAQKAGYEQLELEVVADNFPAIQLYQNLGFIEWGRNPLGFKTRNFTYQELICMRLELQ